MSYTGSLPTIFNIFSDPLQRSSQHNGAKITCGQNYYLQGYANAFLPFQFEVAEDDYVSKIEILFDDSSNVCIDVSGTKAVLFERILPNNRKLISYLGRDLFDYWSIAGGNIAPLDEGIFYARFEISKQNDPEIYYLYSDTFEIGGGDTRLELVNGGARSNETISILFRDSKDWFATNGTLRHEINAPQQQYFRQKIYLITQQSQLVPAFEVSESYEDGNGLEIANTKKVEHVINVEAIVPYCVFRGLATAQLYEDVTIEEYARGRKSKVSNFKVEGESIEDGAFYKITCSFTENIIIRKNC
jgi:hypothetical protein